MFSNKLKTLFLAVLVILLACSLTLFAYAEESNDISDISVADDVSGNTSDTDESITDESGEASDTESSASDGSSEQAQSITENSSEAEGAGSSWTGWIIAGAILIIIGTAIFVSIKKKNAFGQRLVKFFKNYKSEIKKIVWLSRKETFRQTGIVLIIIVVACVFLGLLDYAFTSLIQLI